MHYEVYTSDNQPTGRVIVNSPSEERAKEVWSMFEGNEDINLKPVNLTVPKMFSNCIMDMPES